MKIPALVVIILATVLGSFLAGTWYGQRAAGTKLAPGRRILYYHDPMHPAYQSDKPGIAPDCGMQLEPVFEGQEAGSSSNASETMPPGTMNITLEKQQLIGVRAEVVKSSDATRYVRLLGRVAADERRVYLLNAATDGWIQETFSNSTGSLVKKDEVLATCYAPEFLGAEQAYFYALGALDRFRASGKETSDQIAITQVSVKQAADGLRNLGMGEVQIQVLARDRRITQNIEIRSPATGFILERNVSAGLRFERGKQLYRIADLGRVWVLADAFENEARFIRPDQSARVLYQGRSLQARMSDVLPQFDPATRTLKTRFELDNPGYSLRPDMFVDVEFPISLPPAISVPANAIVDSGLKKTVFVDRGNGFFEPRTVETAWRFGDQVGITRGLEPGERVVVSGNFLIDSESRMRMAAVMAKPEQKGDTVKDPVCGMEVDPTRALKSEYRGETHSFCSDHCKREFEKHPEKYTSRKASLERPPA